MRFRTRIALQAQLTSPFFGPFFGGPHKKRIIRYWVYVGVPNQNCSEVCSPYQPTVLLIISVVREGKLYRDPVFYVIGTPV